MSQKPVDISNIKAVLFDLGGVLLNIDYQLTENAFVDLGVKNFNVIYSQAKQTPLFDDFETGKISDIDFLNELSEYFNTSHNLDDLRLAWNAMLLDFPVQRIELIERIRSKYKTLLLSNTNAIHYDAFNKIISEAHDLEFSTLFDRAYYSHIIGKRKPNADVFIQILDEQNLFPKQVIFIDDSIQHVEGAKKLGINAYLLEKGADVSELLSSISILT